MYSRKWAIAGTDKPCSRCGDCCKQMPCSLGGNPCFALRSNDNGSYSCGLVELGIPGVREYLLIGLGCGATMIPAKFQKR